MTNNPKNITKNGVAGVIVGVAEGKNGVTCPVCAVTDTVCAVTIAKNAVTGSLHDVDGHGNGVDELGNRYNERGNEGKKAETNVISREKRNFAPFVIPATNVVIPANAGIQKLQRNTGFPIRPGMTMRLSGMTVKASPGVK